jgi:hypothetical protein
MGSLPPIEQPSERDSRRHILRLAICRTGGRVQRRRSRTVPAVSLIVADEQRLLAIEEAMNLIWLLRAVETPHAPNVETAAITAAVIVEDAATGSAVGSPSFTDEEERAMLTVLDQAAREVGLSPRLTRLHRALRQAHG